ncbi:MAG: hypothetical protein HOW73_12395 [Polyangiaceae bacterium]|nr:hypothetical protein [Polyangiaceae bacterium]
MESSRAVLLGRPWIPAVLRVFGVVLWMVALSAVLFGAGFGRVRAWGAFVLVLSVVARVAQWRPEPDTSLTGKRGITVDGAGVWHQGTLVVPRSALRQGFVLHENAKPKVRLEHAWGPPTEIAVPTQHDGRAILEALGLDTSQVSADVRAGSILHRYPKLAQQLPTWFVAVVVLLMLLGDDQPGLRVALLAAGGASAVYLLLGAVKTRVRVGIDGISTRWLGRRRFYPFSTIERVCRYDAGRSPNPIVGIELFFHGGAQLQLPVGEANEAELACSALYARVRQALAEFQSAREGARIEALARAGRDDRTWVDALRALGRGEGASHRRAAIPTDRLLTAALDPSAAPRDRACAAIAVGPSLTPDERVRVRESAEASASPKLRIAIERALNDDEGVEEALAALEAEQNEHAPDVHATPSD